MFKLLRRAWLFARDYCDEFGCAWSIARIRDCERNGGHRWGEIEHDSVLKMTGCTCSRCGTFESRPVYDTSTIIGTITTAGNTMSYTLIGSQD